MRDEFLINHRGKTYALFAGLLDEAHDKGLHSIETLIVQPPNDSNGNLAIVFAKVTMDTDSEPADRRHFTGYGDASPENVARNIAPHLIRMAETRAKARALRDAVNIGVTAFEEMGGEETNISEAPQVRHSPRTTQGIGPGRGGDSGPSSRRSEPDNRATEKQVGFLKGLIAHKGSLDVFVEKYGPPENLSKDEASEWIEKLRG